MKLLGKKTTYELTAAELETAIAEMVREKGLATKDQKVSVNFRVADTSDDRFSGGYGSYNLTKAEITIEG